MRQLVILFLLTFSVSVFAQSPWTKKKNEGYVQLSYTTISGYDELFGDPDYSTYGKYSDNTVQLYGELGVSDKTTLFANLPLKIISIDNFLDPRLSCINCEQDFNETALGNIQLGVKHNFYNKNNWVVSGLIAVEANTSNYEELSGIRTGYDAWSLTPLFLAGKSFGNSYFQSFIGVDVRTNGYSSNFKIGGEYGGKIFKNIWLIGFLDVVKSFENGDVVLPISNNFTGLYVNDQEYGGFGAKVIYEFHKNFGLNAGFGGAFFGNNVAKAPSLSLGLYHKF